MTLVMSIQRSRKKHLLLAAVFLFLLSRYRPLLFFTQWHFPFTPHFSKSYILLEPGESYTLKVGGFPSILNCKSSVPFIASVTPGGTVYAHKCGKTVITATLDQKTKKTTRCLVHVTKLNRENLTMCINQSARIYIRGFFFGFGVKYQSSNPNIVKISGRGKIRAVGRGHATIRATLKGKTFQCQVTVK